MNVDSAHLLTSGDVDSLLALHRSLFGSLRMEGEDGDGGDGGDGGAGTGTWTPPASQADLDRIVADRLNRQKSQLAKQYEGHADYKAKAEQFDQLTEAQKSEVQKAIDRAEKAESSTSALTDRLIRAEVKAIASGEFADPADAYAFLGDLSRFLDKTGEPDAGAIEDALKDVLKNKPYLAAATTRTDVGLGARGSATEMDMNALLRGGQLRR